MIQTPMFDGGRHGAYISACGRYRYLLWRTVDDALPSGRILFVLLNPSTADEHVDDPTLRRLCGFARAWRYGKVTVCNVYAYRATDPRILRKVDDPVGPENDDQIVTAAKRANCIVVGWGAYAHFMGRDRHVLRLLRKTAWDGKVHALGLTSNDSPRHPLYIKADAVPVMYGAHLEQEAAPSPDAAVPGRGERT